MAEFKIKKMDPQDEVKYRQKGEKFKTEIFTSKDDKNIIPKGSGDRARRKHEENERNKDNRALKIEQEIEEAMKKAPVSDKKLLFKTLETLGIPVESFTGLMAYAVKKGIDPGVALLNIVDGKTSGYAGLQVKKSTGLGRQPHPHHYFGKNLDKSIVASSNKIPNAVGSIASDAFKAFSKLALPYAIYDTGRNLIELHETNKTKQRQDPNYGKNRRGRKSG